MSEVMTLALWSRRAGGHGRPFVAIPSCLPVLGWVSTRLAWTANSSRIVGSKLEAPCQWRRPRDPAPPAHAAPASRGHSPWVDLQAQLDQPPGPVGGEGRHDPPGTARQDFQALAVERPPPPPPTGGSSSRWMTPKPCRRSVMVQSRSVRHASATMLSAGSMVHVPRGFAGDRSVLVAPGSLRSGRVVMSASVRSWLRWRGPPGRGPGAQTSVPLRRTGHVRDRREPGAGAGGRVACRGTRRPGCLTAGAPALRS
jgi:hypothetical protein